MSEISAIKRRLTAVSQTRQITNAMYLLSSTSMKREAKRVEYTKLYFHRLRATVRDIYDKSSAVPHHYFVRRPGNRAAFLIIAGDKGLCGSYNDDVLKFAQNMIDKHPTHYIETVGRMATEYFTRHGMPPDAETLGAAHDPTLYSARNIVENLMRLYDADLMDEVYIIFTRFESYSRSFPDCVRLLPLSVEDFPDVSDDTSGMAYMPSPKEVFDELLPQLGVGLVFSALVQSSASEHCARMNSMRSATDNADEMSAKLRLEYQTQRQLSITNEIIEITSGAQGTADLGAVSPQEGSDTK